MKHVFILFISDRTWLRYGRRPHYAELIKFANLIVVEEPLKILSKEFLLKPFNAISNYLKYSKGIRIDDKYGIQIIRPILLFSSKIKTHSLILKIFDNYILSVQLKRIIKSNEILYYLLINRFQEWLVIKGKNSRFILDIDDEWSMIIYDETMREQIEKDMRRLIEKVDLSTTVSVQLQKKYSFKNKVVFLPNAVDISHYVPSFEKIITRVKEKDVNELRIDIKFLEQVKNDPRIYATDLGKMKELTKPIVGSISGLAGNWSDFAFMSKVEELLPYNFTMVSSGNVGSPTNPEFSEEYKYYLKHKRMIFLEHLDYSILPDFLEFLDVGIVMHRMDEFNTHSAPNKIWAYLAMGLPVVSTDFLNDYDKEIYEGKVKFAKTPEQYVEFIVQEQHSDNLEKKKKRRELAVRYSTANRAEKLYKLILEKTSNK